MKRLAVVLVLLSVAFAQNSAPTGNRTVWEPSAPGALKELPDGRAQRTVTTPSATVSVIADMAPARGFLDPPATGGADVAYVIIGIRNTSQQTVNIAPAMITLRAVGKKERELKRLTEEKVIERAWQATDRVGGAVPPMAGSLSGGGGNDASLQTAITHNQLDTANRRVQQASEQQTGKQLVKLRDKALMDRELSPGEQVMGMVFFYPYEKKDNLELSIPVGDTTFVFPFSGKKK